MAVEDEYESWYAWFQANPFMPSYWHRVSRQTAALLACKGRPIFLGTAEEAEVLLGPPNRIEVIFKRPERGHDLFGYFREF